MATEIANAYIALQVRMPGVQRDIASVIGGSKVTAAATASGKAIGDKLSKGINAGVSTKGIDAVNAALDAGVAAASKVTDAERGLERARANRDKADAAVLKSEEKLNSLRESGKASAGDVAVAEAKLSSARVDAADASRAVEKASADVAAAQDAAKQSSADYLAALKQSSEFAKKSSVDWAEVGSKLQVTGERMQAVGGSLQEVGSRLTNSITKPALVAAGAVGGIAAAAGWKRLVGIDTARGQFQGLGLDADKVMAQVDKGVTDTSLSMAEGASAAVSILATGAVPLEDLEDQIKRVANVSAAYGIEAEHANYLLNNVLTKNKVTWGDLSQMQQNQIPVVTALADEFGKTGEEIQEMASKGEISVDMLNQALDAKAGAAAESYANTWKGVTANIMANIGKLGAEVLGKVFPQLKGEAQDFLQVLRSDEAKAFAQDVGAVLGDAFTRVSESVKGAIDWWGRLDASQKKMIGAFAGLAVAAGPVLTVVGKLATGIGGVVAAGGSFVSWLSGGSAAAGALGGALKFLMGPWGLLLAGLAAAVAASPELQDALGGIVQVLGGALMEVLQAVMPIFETLASAVIPILSAAAGVLATVLEAVAPILTTILDAVTPLIEVLASILVPILETVGTVITWILGNAVLPALTAAFQWLGDVVKNVSDAIGTAFTWLYDNVIQPVVAYIKDALDKWGQAFTWLWENVLQPVFKTIGDIFTWLWQTIIQPIVTYIVNVVRLWGAIFNWLWQNVLQPVFKAIGDIFSWVWTNIIRPIVNYIMDVVRAWGAVISWLWKNAVKPAFDAIANIFKHIWTNVIRPIVTFIQDKLDILGKAFKWLYENAIKPAWEGVTSVLRKGWAWVRDHVFAPFRDGIDLLKKGFDIGAKGIKKAWGHIKAAAAKPINFVLDTVWNNGLRSFWNDVIGGLGLDDMKLKKAPLVKYASGGVLPGYTPGRDVHDFYSPTGGRLALSGGEAIMRPEFTRAVGGPAGVARLNAAARKGQAFANGGVWGGISSFAGDVLDNIKGAVSVAGDFITDPIGAVKKHLIDGLIKPLIGGVDQNMWLKTAAQFPLTVAKGLGEKISRFFSGGGGEGGGVPGKAMKWQSLWAIVKNAVPGVVKTSDYRPGAVTVNGGRSYHGMGRAIDLVPASMATFNAVARLFPNASELIYSPAGSRQLLNGRPFNGWSDAVRRMHYNHVHLAMANGGVVPKLYDQGGWIPHGGMGLNLTGKPEAVLTPDESKALKKGLNQGGNTYVIQNVRGATVDQIAEQLVWAERRLSRGGKYARA